MARSAENQKRNLLQRLFSGRVGSRSLKKCETPRLPSRPALKPAPKEKVPAPPLNSLLLSLGRINEGFEAFDLPWEACSSCGVVFVEDTASRVLDKNGIAYLKCTLCQQ